jgi:uncharacterized protein (DUF58 family)
VLTRSGWLTAVGAVAAALGGRALGAVELYVFAAVAAALLLLSVVWVRQPAPSLQVHRRINPPIVTVGVMGRVELTITNTGTRRVPPVSLVDPVEGTVGARLSVGPIVEGGRQVVGYRLPTLRRGLLRVGPLAAEVRDPFGLAQRLLPGPGALVITVLPAVDPAPALPMGGGRHEPLPGMSHRVVATSGIEDLVTLRPYVVGDDLRRVHWPSTAHADELQVRRDEERWQGHLTVLLDTQAGELSEEALERAISAAAGIIHTVAGSGDRIRMTVTDGSDSGMVDARRASYALLEDLALIEPHDPADLTVPHADPRRLTPLVLLTGPRPGRALAELATAGFRDTLVVRFTGADEPESDRSGSLTLRPGDTFAGAWEQHLLARHGATR